MVYGDVVKDIREEDIVVHGCIGAAANLGVARLPAGDDACARATTRANRGGQCVGHCETGIRNSSLQRCSTIPEPS
jgi:hypothetical protein